MAHEASPHDHRSTAGADAPLTEEEVERLRSRYASVGGGMPSREETIGLLGGRFQDAGVHGSRRARYRRVMEILSIVRSYDILHGLTPVSFRNLLEELGPTFVKAGQILSMRSEILPESFCAELAKLRTEVEPMPLDTVLETLRAEYDEPLERLFASIEGWPLGSASVAQVHKARLVTGEDVAVKVQRAGVRATMAQDIAIMRSLARHATHMVGDEQIIDIQSVVEELWQSFREETDFLVEARSLTEFRQNNAACAYVTCPKPYMGLCTRHVVVMEYVEGIPIAHTAELEAAGYSPAEIGQKLTDNYATQMLDDGFFHADPHPGNIVISDGKIVYLDLGIMGRLSARDRQVLSNMVFAVGDKNTPALKDGLLRFASTGGAVELDHARLLSDLDAVIQDFGTASLAELDLSRFLNAILALARRNGIELPSSVTMLARSLVTLEGTVNRLLRDKSIVDIIAEHVGTQRRLGQLLADETQAYAREARLAAHGLLGAAAQSSLAMGMLTRGQLRVNMDIGGRQDPLADLSAAFDRLTMGIVIAGLFIGSSVIYYAGMKPLLFGIPVVGFVGFTVAFVLGLRLIAGIMREGKGRRR